MIPCDVLKTEILKSCAGNPHHRLITEQLDQVLSTCTDAALSRGGHDDSPVRRWLAWVKSQKDLKVVNYDIPVGVLPNEQRGKLIDVRVFSRRGPDDAIYENNKSIREKVARGNTVMQIEDNLTCVVYGLKKFTGGLGDDDDKGQGDNQTWKKYFSKPLEEAAAVVATRKANGEAAHFSCVHMSGQFLICAGSKNVHMLISKRGDIEKYTGDRFTVARVVCQAIMDLLDQMHESARIRLLSFLSHTGYTAIFEILDPKHQHIEDLSHLDRSQLCFITWALNKLESNSEHCCLAPHVAIEIAKALGLNAVQYDVLAMSDVENRMSEIRQGYNYEGEVLYFLDKQDCVIGLLKKKTIWYIICRAIREKVKASCRSQVKNPDTFSLLVAQTKIEKRLNEIKLWLGLDDDSLQIWKDLGNQFLVWCLENIDQGNISLTDVADMFPVVWNKYLKVTDHTDRIKMKWNEPEGSDD